MKKKTHVTQGNKPKDGDIEKNIYDGKEYIWKDGKLIRHNK